MKIRHRCAIKLASWVGTQIIRTLCGTMRYRARFIGENYLPDTPDLPSRVIYVFWHENMITPSYQYGRPDVHALVSNHADGQFLAGMLERLGFRTVLGSSNRGGTEAIRRMLKLSRESHLAITPDGPRGPRRKIKPGVIYLAARTGMPIVPMGFGCDRAWRAKSWDRLVVPKLFSNGCGVTAPPIFVPRDVTKDDAMEPFRQEVEETLDAVSEIAERWAMTGVYDIREYTALKQTRTWSPAVTFSSR